MTATVELSLHVLPESQDLIIASLADLGFSAFMQDDAWIKAYLPATEWDDACRQKVVSILNEFHIDPLYEESTIPPQDWNAAWEQSMPPISVGPFLIKPTWASTPRESTEKLVLNIDPKMSFGTGHHESTRLVLRLLPEFIRSGERVLDAGAGTGILTIAALRLGAASAVAFDIDEWAQINIDENLALNGLTADFRTGDISLVPEIGFDIVLANINRNVLIELMSEISFRVRDGGHVILSGLLCDDKGILLKIAGQYNLCAVREETEGEWWSVVLRKEPAA